MGGVGGRPDFTPSGLGDPALSSAKKLQDLTIW